MFWYTEPESASPSRPSFGLYIDNGFVESNNKFSDDIISLSCKIKGGIIREMKMLKNENVEFHNLFFIGL